MTAARWRYLLGTSGTPFLMVFVGMGLGYSTLAKVSWWRGDWWWGYNHMIQAMPLVMVVVALASGWTSGRTSGGYAFVRQLRPDAHWKLLWTLAGPPIFGALLTYGIAVAIIGYQTVTFNGLVDSRSWVVLGVHTAMICFSGLVGVCWGRLAPAPVAAGLSAATVAFAFFVPPQGGMKVFDFLGTAGPGAGQTPTFVYWLSALGVLTVLAALLVGQVFARRSSMRWLLGTAAVVAFMIPLFVGPRSEMIEVGDPPDRCREAEVTVCVFPGYERALGTTIDGIERFLEAAETRGVSRDLFPVTYMQYSDRQFEAGEGVAEFSRFILRDGKPAPDDIASSVSTPMWCDAVTGEDDDAPEDFLDHVNFVGLWAEWIQGKMSEESWEVATDGLLIRHVQDPDLPATARRITNELEYLKSCGE